MRSGEISLPICRLIPTYVSGSRVLSSQARLTTAFSGRWNRLLAPTEAPSAA